MKLLGTKRVKITPDLARQFIERHPPMNPVYWPHVHKYAADMREGKWNTRYAPGIQIIVDQDARILDGTHRIRAVVESNRAQTFTIIIMQCSDAQRTRLQRLGRCGVA